jgi:hypothetical protein
VPLNEISGDDQEDTELLTHMAELAVSYVRSQKWCQNLKNTYFSDGIGGIVAVAEAALSNPGAGAEGAALDHLQPNA